MTNALTDPPGAAGHSQVWNIALYQFWPWVSPRVVMDVLGHSQIAVTMNIYGHVIPAMQQEAANEIDAALGDDDSAADDAGEWSRG